MSKTQPIITAVVLEGRSKSAVARDYDVSRQWVHQLVRRYQTDGNTAFEPRSRRPTTARTQSVLSLRNASRGCAKPWTKRATTPARPPSPNS
jgi:transposase